MYRIQSQEGLQTTAQSTARARRMPGLGTPILELDLELGGALYGVSRLMIQLRLNVTAAPDREPLAGRAAFASIQRRQSPGR